MDERSSPWFFDCLPYRPPPFPDECVSGYLLRLAEVNGFPSLWALTQGIFPDWHFPQSQAILRWEYPTAEWARLARFTQLTVDALNRLTLLPLTAKLGCTPDRLHPVARAALLRGLVNPSLRLCPQCVAEQPYVRLRWRLLPVEVCLRHGCVLMDHCPRCQAPLTVIGYGQQHLRCSHCQADLCHNPRPIAALAQQVQQQSRSQADWACLLDPGVSLARGVPVGGPEMQTVAGDVAGAIAMKFRFLLDRTGQTIAAWARTTGIAPYILNAIHAGRPVRLSGYLQYLATFDISWPEFAGLQVPDAFVRQLHTPAHLPLRVCPTPGCAHSQAPTSAGVMLRADLPDQRLARFQCRACGRHFTRAYDGRLTSRSLTLTVGHLPPKSGREVARLKRMGLRGASNRAIARALGWGEKTVRHYWIGLGLRDQVKQAQAAYHADAKGRRSSELRKQVDVILRRLTRRGEVITVTAVMRELGHTGGFAKSYPELIEYVDGVVLRHNATVRARRLEVARSELERVLAELPLRDGAVTLEAIAGEVGLSPNGLRKQCPDLYAALKVALRSHRLQARQARDRERVARIDAGAKRLMARGERLSGPAIIREAGFSRYARSSPVIREAIRRWVGGFAPRD